MSLINLNHELKRTQIKEFNITNDIVYSSNVPQLRFPEFINEWKGTTLGNVSNNIMYGLNLSAINFDGFHKYINNYRHFLDYKNMHFR